MTDEERLARAGDYVLGLLDAAGRAEAERDMEIDASFRAAVERLTARMHGLDLTAEPAAVPDTMWPSVLGRIADTPQDGVDAAVIPFPVGKSPRPNWSWRGSAVAASLAIGFGLGYLAAWLTSPDRQPAVVVVLQTPENTPGAFFEAFDDNSVRIVPLEDFVVPEGKIMQVWTLYDQAVGPVSLGTLPESGIEMLEGRPLPRPVAEQLYEITLEPFPESPTGKPTGPILVKGFARQPVR